MCKYGWLWRRSWRIIWRSYKDATQEEQQVEEPKEEVVEPEPVKDISNDVDSAYELVKPIIEENFGSLDHEFIIMNGELMLIGYISSNEVYYGISDGSWNELISNAEYASTNIKNVLDTAGYTNVSFNVSMCDNVKRQDLCFLLVKNGTTFYNIANELQ